MLRLRQTVGGAPVEPGTDWTGIAVLLLAWSAILNGFVSKVIDGRHPVTTSSGTVQFVSNSHFAGYVGAALVLLAAVTALIGLLRSDPSISRHTAFSVLISLALIWWLLCALVLRRDDVDQVDLPFDIAAALVVLCVTVTPLQNTTLRAFNLLRDLTALGMLITSFADPTGSQIACRSDKCGVFGSLFTGFYYTENSAAQLVLVLLPAAIATRSRVRLAISLMLAALFVLATGSRTSLVGLVLASAFIVLYRPSEGLPLSRRTGLRLWASAPIFALAVSTAVFLTFSGEELTGRGYIYAGIRSQLRGYALIIGSGPGTMKRVFETNMLGTFEAIGEHGEASHLLVESGFVGFALVAIGLFALPLARAQWTTGQVAAVGFAVTASLQFVTEPGWTMDSRALNFVSLLLAAGLFRHERSTTDGPYAPQPLRSAAALGAHRASASNQTDFYGLLPSLQGDLGPQVVQRGSNHP